MQGPPRPDPCASAAGDRAAAGLDRPIATLSLEVNPCPTASHQSLEDLFAETLKDVYFAEKQILRALPKMAKEATTPELKTSF